MKTTLSWLKEHLDTTASIAEISEALTNLGLVVDSISDPAQKLGAFRIVEVLEAAPHPQADRLQVCRVHTGEREIQVVCGAANARTGIKAVLALPGDVIPATGTALKKGMIRGVESQGMLCSYAELDLFAADFGKDEGGIIELSGDFVVGSSLIRALGLTDPVMDIEITPNRGDALGVRGIARDLAAANLGTLKPLSIPTKTTKIGGVSIAPSVTALFASCFIRNVKNGPSPAWLQQRLKAIGHKPISALVDITNYLAFDLGRPLHVFDADKIQGSLELRLSQEGEFFEALNGQTYTLPAGFLVIADRSGVISLAGIMGGASTACGEQTTNVLLEAAFFPPDLIRKGGQATGILSDARTRFERGVDSASVIPGMAKALEMIVSFCGGSAGEIHLSEKTPEPARPVSLSLKALEKRGGLAVSAAKASDVLEKLGFSPVVKGEAIETIPPSWRFDIEAEEDLVEEVLRVVGYSHILPVFLPFRPILSALTPLQQRPFKLKRCLAARGFYEVITWSFLSKEKGALFGESLEALTLLNPISADLAVMRPSLLPPLLDLALYHRNRSLPFNPIFEVGPQYTGTKPEDQHMMLTALIPLQPSPHWQPLPSADIFQAKAHLWAALEACNVNPAGLTWDSEKAPTWYHPSRSGVLKQGRKELAFFGEIHPEILQKFSLDGRYGAFEVFLDRFAPPKALFPKPPLSLSSYQPISRDLAFVMDRTVSCEKLTQALRNAAGKNLTALSMFDVFESAAQLGTGKKSIAFRLTFQSFEGTLTEDLMVPLLQGMIQEAARVTGATLRGPVPNIPDPTKVFE